MIQPSGRERERQQARETLFKGISDALDGKPPEGWLQEVRAFRDILRGEQAAPEQVETRGRGRDL